MSSVNADFNHVALHVRDLDASIAFYRDFGQMSVFSQRESSGSRVAWLVTSSRRTVLVLVCERHLSLKRRVASAIARILPPGSHLGVALDSREEVERLCAQARSQGVLRREPAEHGPPVGFYGMLRDPDGNSLELSFNQEMLDELQL